ncbi:MAG: dephospho-CoA kinase [Sphingorhabdus sp.]
MIPDRKPPLIIGLTGSIAMGKSTVAAMFEDEGVPVFDADAAVHQLQKAGGLLVAAIESAFPGTTGPQGVDRQKLGAAVLGDKQKLKQLESIIHPAVGAMRNAFLANHTDRDIIVFDIPLLFEKGGHADVDHIVVVSAPADQQRARALSRPGVTVEKFENILKLQTPDAEKRAKADTVIDTGQSIEHTRCQVRALVKKLRDALAVSDK